MVATAASESSPCPQMRWPTYATPQTTSAKNTSERTSVPIINRCFQIGLQRFLFVACSKRSCSVVSSVTDNLCSASLLSNTSSRTSVRKEVIHLYHTSVLVAGTDL